MVLRQTERQLGAVLEIPPDASIDGGEQTVTLRPLAAITGRVLTEGGKPAAGRVEVFGTQLGVASPALGRIAYGQATLDADGRFRIADIPAGGTYQMQILVPRNPEKPNAGMRAIVAPAPLRLDAGATLDLGTLDISTGELRIIPSPAAPVPSQPASVAITGRIIDLEGRPVAGVKVTPGSYQTFKRGNLALWLDATRQGRPPWVETPGLEVDWDAKAPEATRLGATTDAAGRFRIDGFDPESVPSLQIQGDTIALDLIQVVPRPIAPLAAVGIANQYGPGSTTIYGSDFTYSAQPSRWITGVVKDAATGEPLAGAEVRSYRFAGSNFVGTMPLRTQVDGQGRFRLTGLPKGLDNEILVVPGDDQPYLLQKVKLPDPPGAEAIAIEVAMPRGLWIEGKITEQATGLPIQGAWLHYLPYFDNPFAQAHPSFGTGGNGVSAAIQNRYQSRPDGTYRLVGLSGRAIVGAISHRANYLQGVGSEAITGLDKNDHFPTYAAPVQPCKLWPTAMKEINPPADATTVHLDLAYRTGPAVRVRVEDSAGRPVADALGHGLTGRESRSSQPMGSAEGRVLNLLPDEDRTVLFVAPGRQLGKAVRVRAGADTEGPVVVRLEPLARLAGRVVDAAGNPCSAAQIRPGPLPSGDFSLSLPQVIAGPDGRFVVPAVPVGAEYYLAVENGVLGKDRRFSYFLKATVEPGATTDVGDIRFKD